MNPEAELIPDNERPGYHALIVGGLPRCCPFRAPMMAQTKFGSTQIIETTCGTWCALFRATGGAKGGTAYLRCGCGDEYNLKTIRESNSPEAEKKIHLAK